MSPPKVFIWLPHSFRRSHDLAFSGQHHFKRFFFPPIILEKKTSKFSRILRCYENRFSIDLQLVSIDLQNLALLNFTSYWIRLGVFCWVERSITRPLFEIEWTKWKHCWNISNCMQSSYLTAVSSRLACICFGLSFLILSAPKKILYFTCIVQIEHTYRV